MAVVRLSNPFSGRPCSQMPASDESCRGRPAPHAEGIHGHIAVFIGIDDRDCAAKPRLDRRFPDITLSPCA